jgi:hypothetical protein
VYPFIGSVWSLSFKGGFNERDKGRWSFDRWKKQEWGTDFYQPNILYSYASPSNPICEECVHTHTHTHMSGKWPYTALLMLFFPYMPTLFPTPNCLLIKSVSTDLISIWGTLCSLSSLIQRLSQYRSASCL